MQSSRAAIFSAGFFMVAPGSVVGLIPWSITRWRFDRPLHGWIFAQTIGAILVAAGLVVLVWAFTEFVKSGGTPSPTAPPPHLVVTGFNRYVRNPMYVGLLLAIVGQALIFGNFALLIWAAVVWLATAAFVRWYEQPTLARQFGAEYDAYRAAVPAWWPRLHAWSPEPLNGARSNRD